MNSPVLSFSHELHRSAEPIVLGYTTLEVGSHLPATDANTFGSLNLNFF